MGIVTGWGNWRECPRTASMQGSYLKNALWWFTWRISHIPPRWICWGCFWSRKRKMSLHVPITLRQPHLGQAIPRSRRSAITDSQLLKREMTAWMPWKVGTMMDSSSVSGKLLWLANPGVAVASTARKKVTIGINGRRPSPWSSKNCPISKIGSERNGRKGL